MLAEKLCVDFSSIEIINESLLLFMLKFGVEIDDKHISNFCVKLFSFFLHLKL